jgi:hypothetical protein
MASSCSESKIMDGSLIEDPMESFHQSRSVKSSTDESCDPVNALNACPRTTVEDESENSFRTVQHDSSCDGLNSSEATNVSISSEEMSTDVRNVNITNNLGSTLVCVKSEFNFDRTKPLKTEAEAKKLTNEAAVSLPNRLPFDEKQLGGDQLEYGSLNTNTNRSEFCLEEAKDSEASFKVYTAPYRYQLNNVEDNHGIIMIATSSPGALPSERNVSITNNFGTILVCYNTDIYFSGQPNNAVIFDGKPRFPNEQSSTKCDLAKSHNRSEFCLSQALGSLNIESGAKFEALASATCDKPIQIQSNFGIVIINVCRKYRSQAPKTSSDPKEAVDEIENINITNNFGNTVVCNESRVNIDLPANDAIKMIDIQDGKAVFLNQKLTFDGKQLEDGQSHVKCSLINRSEFCHKSYVQI